MNVFHVGNPRSNPNRSAARYRDSCYPFKAISDACRLPLGESNSAGNRGKRLAVAATLGPPNRRGSPRKRPRITPSNLRPTPLPRRLRRYIARQDYTTESDRYYLGPMDQICSKCSAASFKDETPQWCYVKGKTNVVAPESKE